MQILELDVKGLFGRFDHRIVFSPVQEQDPSTSVTILYGMNGVGKTTLLRFLEALLGESRGGAWDVFRTVPFEECTLRLSDMAPIKVRPNRKEKLLWFEFEDEIAALGGEPAERAAPNEEQREQADNLMDRFDAARAELSFQFLGTERLRLDEEHSVADPGPRLRQAEAKARALAARERDSLSNRMRQFIARAQLDYTTFFTSVSESLFERIIDRLASKVPAQYDPQESLEKIHWLLLQDEAAARFDLAREDWDHERLENILHHLPTDEAARDNTLAVIAQYLEMLEDRALQRGLVADRLSTFEKVMGEFLDGKTVSVSARDGLETKTTGESPTVLTEWNLSSGERHLLYLMSSAVMTRRKGTVIVIDEPEMSMHIAWQRSFIPALVKCAARAEPQFIFATHSPEIIAGYEDSLVELKA